MEKVFAVITTIQKPTISVEKLLSFLAPHNIQLIVAGDRKGPDSFEGGQRQFPFNRSAGKVRFQLATLLPENHYVRKNLGYLNAIAQVATCIYETDDDNAPNENWNLRDLQTNARKVVQDGG